jgi:hypothetical protein
LARRISPGALWSDYTGQGKWQVGPAAIVGYLSKKWILGGFFQNWTSFGGSGNRPDTNQMNLQPIAAYFLPDGWSIGYSGNSLANWKADKAGDIWTVPLGLSVSKVVKFGKLQSGLLLRDSTWFITRILLARIGTSSS